MAVQVPKATRATSEDVDRRLEAVIAEQEAIFVDRQPRSSEIGRRAVKALAGGVTSSWMITRPQSVWISHGKGSRIWDVDGTEYVDMHGGYGAGLAGHAHPAIVETVSKRVRLGTHFAQPTEDAIIVAEELGNRWGLPLWRFTNSGTESTMDAVHLMRAITGRDLIVKIEGCYHGHHDSVQLSVTPEADEIGPAEHPIGAPASTGIPEGILALTKIASFNSLDSLRRLFEDYPGQIAGMIIEPIMMNAGIIMPEEGYLAGLKELLHEHGALLTFDEVKTGLTVGPGGATRMFGTTPDIVCLAKSIGGGLCFGAVGGTEEVMSYVANGVYAMVGTFNGNPLSVAVGRTVLEEIATEQAYKQIRVLHDRIDRTLSEVIATAGLPAHVVSVGAKGCVTFSTKPVRDYREFLEIDDRYNHAHWLFQHNGGVFLPPWGKTEQWLISVQHDEEDVDRFLANFERFAKAVQN